MITTLLLFAPLILTILYGGFLVETKRVPRPGKTEIISMFLVAFLTFIHVYALVYEHEHSLYNILQVPSLEFFGIVRALATSMLFPLAYVFLSSCVGKPLFSRHFFYLVAMIWFGLPFCSDVYLDGVIGDTSPIPGLYRFFMDGKCCFWFSTYDYVVLMQVVLMIIWSIGYVREMGDLRYHFSRKVKGVFVFGGGVLLLILALEFVPYDVAHRLGFVPYGFALILTLAYSAFTLLFIKGWITQPVLDENNEPVVETVRTSEQEMQEKVRDVVEGERLYLNSELQLADVARAIGTNRTYISRAVNAMSGVSFNNYLNALRVDEAKKLILSDHSLRLEEVADKCGFSSASSFTKIFKKETGVTPKEWRTNPQASSISKEETTPPPPQELDNA